MKKIIYVNNLNDTKELAKRLACLIKPGMVILLDGDLGAGKTTFTQNIGKYLGVKRAMTSPTFNIIKSYQADEYIVHHMDCYRLEDSDEDLGFDEYMNDEDVTFIEWYNFIEDFLPKEHLIIHIEQLSTDEREFNFIASGSQYEQLVGEL